MNDLIIWIGGGGGGVRLNRSKYISQYVWMTIRTFSTLSEPGTFSLLVLYKGLFDKFNNRSYELFIQAPPPPPSPPPLPNRVTVVFTVSSDKNYGEIHFVLATQICWGFSLKQVHFCHWIVLPVLFIFEGPYSYFEEFHPSGHLPLKLWRIPSEWPPTIKTSERFVNGSFTVEILTVRVDHFSLLLWCEDTTSKFLFVYVFYSVQDKNVWVISEKEQMLVFLFPKILISDL